MHTPRQIARRPKARCGQTMVEYVIAAGILLASLTVLYLFRDTFDEFGTRVLNLAAYDYP